jgi:hypothetical protein
LPTLQDDAEVVKAKLAGLETEINKKKGRRVDALDDAGYNVTKFRARGAAAPPGDTTAKPLRFNPATGRLEAP